MNIIRRIIGQNKCTIKLNNNHHNNRERDNLDLNKEKLKQEEEIEGD